MSHSLPDLPSGYICRRIQPTDTDHLKFLMMPRSPGLNPSWIPIKLILLFYQIRIGIFLLFLSTPFIWAWAIYLENTGQSINISDISILYLVCFGVLILLGTASLIGFRKSLKYYWAIEEQEHFIGYACLFNYSAFSVLIMIRIHRYWRRKGLGTAFINTLLLNYPRPLYLQTNLNTTRFYQQSGFRKVCFKQLPLKVQKVIKNVNSSVIMMHE